MVHASINIFQHTAIDRHCDVKPKIELFGLTTLSQANYLTK
jgi:hypothetical protein